MTNISIGKCDMANNTFSERINTVVNQLLKGNWAELARVSNLTPSTIHAIKKGSQPRSNTIKRICDPLKINANWLITGQGGMQLEIDLKGFDRTISTLYSQLSEQQRKEVASTIKEKIRLNDLEMEMKQMKKRFKDT